MKPPAPTAPPPSPAAPTLASALVRLARGLAAAGSTEPEAEARYALRELLGLPAAALALARLTPAPPGADAALDDYLARRSRGEPPQYIVGRAHFLDLTLAVRPGCLIPRPETELLAEAARELLGRCDPPRFLEIGVGSGCITAALLAAHPSSAGVATDRSAAALGIARDNLAALGLLPRATLREDDLYTGTERFPLIVSNPPYIATGALAGLAPELAFEPREALDGGPDGLAVIARILDRAPALLAPGGHLALETGHDQTDGLALLARERRLALLEHHRDLAGHPRVAILKLI